MRTKLLTLALMAFGLATLTTSVSAQNFLVFGITNQVWRYYEEGNQPDPAWMTEGYSDTGAGWKTGRAALGWEPSGAPNGIPNWVNNSNTTLNLFLPDGTTRCLSYYFRSTFTLDRDPSTVVLTASNLVDDGLVVYINGQEAGAFNVTATRPTVYAQNAPAAFGEGSFNILRLSSSSLRFGENLIAVEVHQNGTASSDVVFGMGLHGNIAYAPRITREPVASTNVLEGRSFSLSVVADASPPPTYQWYKDGTPITDATNATITVNNMSSGDAGGYHVDVTNPFGTASSIVSAVSYTADTFPPVLLFALMDVNNPARLILQFDESVKDFEDTFKYAIDFAEGGSASGVSGFEWNANTNQVILLLNPALDPALRYTVRIDNADGLILADLFNNPLAHPTTADILFPKSFQEGLNGYVGTQDTEIHSNAGAATPVPDAVSISIDLEDAGVAQGLIRFDNVFGPGSEQVPTNAVIHQALLRFHTLDVTAANTPIRVLGMLADWDEATATWDSLVNGLDTEVGPEQGRFDGSQAGEFDDVDVTAAVREYLGKAIQGQEFYGWALLATGNNGYDFESSENGSAVNRPALLIAYTAPETRCNITQQPVGATVAEGGSFTLSVVAEGNPLEFQWYKDNTPIAGANSRDYTVNNALPSQHSGLYHVVARNRLGACTSDGARVTVQGDRTGDQVVNAIGREDQTTIVLTFNDAMDPTTAQNTANYSLSGGLAVSSATLTNGTNVILVTAARTPNVNYNITVTGVRDNSEAGNVISPASQTLALAQRVRVFGFGDTWKYDETGTSFDGTGWETAGYNDSAWLSGPGMFGYETSTAATNFHFANGLAINTLWNTNNGKITFYARKSFPFAFNVSNVDWELRHITDDGHVIYVNGTEAGRYNMTNSGVITNGSLALIAAPETAFQTSDLGAAPFRCGNNVIAVEVHQNSATSSDVVWGSELIAIVPSFNTDCPQELTIQIRNNGDGTVTITRSGGTLVQSDSVTGPYTPSANQANPQTIPASAAARFYQARIP